MKIAIVKYNAGNVESVKNALNRLDLEPIISDDAEILQTADKVIFPGVGEASTAMNYLRERKLDEVIKSLNQPVLGICLGMQVMAKCSYEGGHYECLDWFNAEVVRLEPSDLNLRVPHVGWNNINYSSGSILFANLPASPDVYFVHSYHMQCSDSQDEIANCEYGGNVTVAVQKRNIMAVQFHPEKSQDYGLTILENFLRWQS
ncbi:MAG: imidazole glycerol phosphate synthase subunit HisH [Hydrococcus sp. RU_2_2]|nr:imidazole glycerol phosphate synthase subunit HisH [Hydrococcus sp. RU_2_2]